MKKITLCAAVLAIASSAFATGAWELATAPRLLDAGTADKPGEIGMWEYVYDYVADGDQQLQAIRLTGFDTDLIVNKRDPEGSGWLGSGPYTQKWEGFSATEGGVYSKFYGNFTTVGSVSHDLTTWAIEDPINGIDNIWHSPSDYNAPVGYFGVPDFRSPGWNFGTDGTPTEGIEFRAKASQNTAISGLLLTTRIVHPNAPGEITYDIWTYYGNAAGTITGPGSPVFDPGDVDEDGDIDADDIDLMGQAIRTGTPPTAANYDLSADGTTGGTDATIDVLDLDYLVRFLVQTSIGNGTEYGDFNLDGLVDTTDLTRLGTDYGAGGDKWAKGNANPHIDVLTDTTDLTILATYFGQGPGDPDAIPEPATLSLLGLGAAALIRRRK